MCLQTVQKIFRNFFQNDQLHFASVFETLVSRGKCEGFPVLTAKGHQFACRSVGDLSDFFLVPHFGYFLFWSLDELPRGAVSCPHLRGGHRVSTERLEIVGEAAHKKKKEAAQSVKVCLLTVGDLLQCVPSQALFRSSLTCLLSNLVASFVFKSFSIA